MDNIDFKLKEKLGNAIKNASSLEPMRTAFRSVLKKQEESRKRMGNLEEQMKRLREARNEAIGNNAMLKQAISNLEANGIRCVIAEDPESAVQIIISELEGRKLLVKSKSNLSREISLLDNLQASGIEVIETDIGDRVIQISKEKPVHPTGPCAHLDRKRISSSLSAHLGRKVKARPEDLIKEILNDLKPFIERAEIGLTGVNAISAAEGSLVFLHNEGNIDLVSLRPKKLIVLGSIDKIYPDLASCMTLARVETWCATGQHLSSFIRVISGPSKTADIEKEIYSGIHGPREITLIILDNGRSALANDEEVRESLLCIGCGACILECPIYDILGPEFGTEGRQGGIGVVRSFGASSTEKLESEENSLREKLEKTFLSGLPFCLTCANCKERCPVDIDIPQMIEALRAKARSSGIRHIDEHEQMLASIRNYGNPFPAPKRRRDRVIKGRELPNSGITHLFAGCSLSLVKTEVLQATLDVLSSFNIKPSYSGAEEVCCGSPALRLGERNLFLELAKKNIQNFHNSRAKEIITLCPACLKTLRSYATYFPDFKTPVKHISEILVENIRKGEIALSFSRELTVTYHDPCHLGRGCGIYDEPREILCSIEGLKLVEMEKTREYSACCGSGGGVKTAFPELSYAIGEKRKMMAENTGADLIVTSCPWCEINISECGGNVKDIMEIVFQSLKK